ncbi:MAG: TolC family protein [Polyangiales bacterium]
MREYLEVLEKAPAYVCVAAILCSGLVADYAMAQARPEVPNDPATGPVALSFDEAIRLGIERNVRTVISRQGIQTAKGERLQSLSGLLPNVSGTMEQTRRTANLVSVGLDPDEFSIGNGVFGPFNTFDARLNATQTIFSLAAIGAAQAGKASLDRSEVKYVLSTHLVFQKVGETYVQVLEAQSAVDAFEADLALAKELDKDTEVAFDSGVATALDKARAKSRALASETRLLQAQTALAVSTNQLKALLLVPQASTVSLTTPLRDQNVSLPPVDQAVREAQANRPDIKFSEETIRIASYKHRAAVGQQVPALGFGVNYGGSGDTIASNVNGTYLIGGVLSVPLFDGGNTVGAIKAARSRQYEAEQVLRQLKEDTDEQVRSALQSITYASQEVLATAEQLKVTELALKLSRDRFFNGVSDNLELVASQTSLSTARNQYVRALAKYNDARIQLAVALGSIQGFTL